MSVTLDTARLFALAPRVQPVYRAAFADYATTLPPFGLTTARRLEHFLAQVLHESGGLSVLVEDLDYRAERLMQVWPTRFATVSAAQAYAHAPEKLSNFVYAGRMGNKCDGDGWRFRGRGLLQLTGRSTYARVGSALDVDLVAEPDLVVSARYALLVAAEFWRAQGGNAAADTDNLRAVTRAINGGLVGLVSRAEWLRKAREIIA